MQVTLDLHTQGTLNSQFLRNHVLPFAEPIAGLLTNMKFKARGPTSPKSKTVIIAVDNASVDQLGRFPWHRDTFASVIHAAVSLGAKQVALDITFSEPEDRIPRDLYETLSQDPKNAQTIKLIQQFESDPILEETIKTHQDKIVLGYATLSEYNTHYYSKDQVLELLKLDAGDQFLEVYQQSLDRTLPQIEKFSFQKVEGVGPDQFFKSPVPMVLDGLFNIPAFNAAAKNAGFFTATLDQDGYIRRYKLAMIHQGRVVPSLALATYLASKKNSETISFEFNKDHKVTSIKENNQPLPIPLNSDGSIQINFRGPPTLATKGSNYNRTTEENLSFPFVSAIDVLTAYMSPEANPEITANVKATIQDSYAFFGVTALGLHDMRSFPFGSNTPGVEGHAAAFDNLMGADPLKGFYNLNLFWLPIALIWAMGAVFTVAFTQLGAIASILIFTTFATAGGLFDFYLFTKGYNLNTIFILIEVSVIFLMNLSIKYIMEEQNKKFIRDAFSRYLAPQVVDYVLKNPEKLSVGGDRKDLSIVFTDLRGFTTLSETMDPKTLSTFLNEYLTAMTNIIFEMGGTLDKYIGDAVMAFWGAPIDASDHAYKACSAAVMMQKRLNELQGHFKQKYNVDVAMGVGVNSGLVSVGNMGSEKIFEYTVIGDHVNLASRLEGLTKYYGAEILCSRFTIDAIPENFRKDFHYRLLDSVKVKGKNQAIDLIELSPLPYDPKAMEYLYLGKEAYKKREWDKAIEHFAASQKEYLRSRGKPDKICELLMERAEEFKINPPPPEWDGSHEMKEK